MTGTLAHTIPAPPADIIPRALPNISRLDPKANKSQYKPADLIVVVAFNAAEAPGERDGDHLTGIHRG